MENDFRTNQKKGYNAMRMSYDLTIAVLLLGMAAAMFFAERLGLDQFAGPDNDLFRYFFGTICVLYGGFRLYRGLKRNY